MTNITGDNCFNQLFLAKMAAVKKACSQQIEIIATALPFPTDDLQQVLTTHPTYGSALNEYLQSEEVCHQLLSGEMVNNNKNLQNGSISLHNKKSE